MSKQQPDQEKPKEFHFWRILFVSWAVVGFCALVAWGISTYFSE